MKSIQKYRALGIIVIAFVFFNTFVMSDSGWVDENDNIYSHVDGKVGIGTDSPGSFCHIKHSASGSTPSNISGGLFVENEGTTNS